jgi:hypothetical protein
MSPHIAGFNHDEPAVILGTALEVIGDDHQDERLDG